MQEDQRMPEFAELREINRRIDEMAVTQKAPEKQRSPGGYTPKPPCR
jgi:hypothetical protein